MEKPKSIDLFLIFLISNRAIDLYPPPLDFSVEGGKLSHDTQTVNTIISDANKLESKRWLKAMSFNLYQ